MVHKLNSCLYCQHPIWTLVQDPLFHFQSSSLLLCLGKKQESWPKCLVACTLWRSQKSLASIWPSSGHWGHLGNEPAGWKINLVLPLTPFSLLAAFQINLGGKKVTKIPMRTKKTWWYQAHLWDHISLLRKSQKLFLSILEFSLTHWF